MDTLSYLIEHNNQVKIDQRLVKEYQRENDTGMPPQVKKSKERSDKPPSPLPVTRPRPLKTYTRISPGNSNGNSQSPKLSIPVSRKNLQKVSLKEMVPEVLASTMSDKQLIALLTTRIESLRDNQREAEQKYIDSIQQLKSQLNRCNIQYEQQCQEFDKIKSEIVGTKKDIASLIVLVQKNKVNNNDEEYIRQSEREHKPVFNKGQLATGSPRSVLSNFIKVGPAARQ